ncbi:MAG: M20 family metallopeptidase [bacterium]|nr:M20 family metallopeptidase [bacterium]
MTAVTKQLEKLTLNLLKFKTLKDEVGKIKSCIEWITKEFGEGVVVTQFPHKTAPSILLTPNGILNPKILFVGHIDVVPAEESQFVPKTENSRLYGRGAFDMKGPLVAALLVFQNAVKNPRPDGHTPSVGVLITSDEEIGGKEGVGRILAEHPLQPEVAVVPDGGNAFEVAEGGKGVAWLEITTNTKAGHVSRPWEGKNAIQLMAKILIALEEKYPGMRESETDETTLSPISISTENIASNVIPNHASASFNIRFVNDFDFDELRKTVEQFPGASATIKRSTEPYYANLAHPLAQKFLEIVEEKTSDPVKTSVYPSTCDARFFAYKNIPVIVTRPEGDGAHGPDEWVDLESLALFEQVLEKFVEDCA